MFDYSKSSKFFELALYIINNDTSNICGRIFFHIRLCVCVCVIEKKLEKQIECVEKKTISFGTVLISNICSKFGLAHQFVIVEKKK